MHHSAKSVLATAAAALLLSTGAAFAELLNFSAELSGAAEVPPADTAGTGTLEATFDTESMAFSWTVTYDGLTGPAAAAHYHGPAAEGENAGPVLPIEGDLASPIEGEATLDEQQASDLQAGLWYFNIHTEQYPDGELRGQVLQGDAMGADGAMEMDAEGEMDAEVEEAPESLVETDPED
jgi:hypothetical protein